MSAQTPAHSPHAAHPPPTMPARAAALILDAFLDYNERFSDITRRAQRWFERRNWKQAQIDLVWRMDLYDECLARDARRDSSCCSTIASARARCGPRCASEYETLVEPLLDRELTKTFFNSLSRRFFRTSGVDRRHRVRRARCRADREHRRADRAQCLRGRRRSRARSARACSATIRSRTAMPTSPRAAPRSPMRWPQRFGFRAATRRIPHRAPAHACFSASAAPISSAARWSAAPPQARRGCRS